MLSRSEKTGEELADYMESMSERMARKGGYVDAGKAEEAADMLRRQAERIAELEQDAQRLDWVESQLIRPLGWSCFIRQRNGLTLIQSYHDQSKPKAREAIDAAIAESKGKDDE